MKRLSRKRKIFSFSFFFLENVYYSTNKKNKNNTLRSHEEQRVFKKVVTWNWEAIAKPLFKHFKVPIWRAPGAISLSPSPCYPGWEPGMPARRPEKCLRRRRNGAHRRSIRLLHQPLKIHINYTMAVSKVWCKRLYSYGALVVLVVKNRFLTCC